MKTKKDKKKDKRDDGAQDKPVDGAIGISNKKKMKMKKENEKVVEDGTDGAQDKPNERRSSKRSGRDGKAVIADARFSAVHSDPRFQHLSKHHSKVTLDSRFSSVFSDRAFSSSAPIDKRGKRKKLNPKDHPLLHYYRQEEDAGIGEDVDGDSSSASDSELSVDAHVFSSSEDDDVDGDDEDGAGDASLDIDPKNIFKEDIPIIERETHRLAIVNLDWKYVKAVDLYVLLNSCLPKDGQILLVAIYPSEFGLKRMEEEAVHGPAALFESNKKNDEEDDNDDDEYKERLREYERSTLRYYFAVVECDSSATADYLYKTCDGIELERSSNVLDLRFIPDSMEFKHPPRDIVTEAPSNYQILDFQTPALQQSNIQLSWDEDEPGRKILKRKLKSEQLADVDLQEFLASDDGESSEGDDDKNNDDEALPDGKCQKLNKFDLYRALIQSRDGSDAEEDNDKDMEVTFNTGLEDISKRILEKKDKKSETVWEAYLKKRREKKKARKGGSKYSSDDDDSSDSEVEVPDEPDDFFIEEPSDADVKVGKKSSSKDSIKKSTGKKHRKERKPSPEAEKEQEASRAELELLLADDQGTDHNLKGYNLKSKKHKGKRGKEIPADDDIPSIDYDDPRFSAMFTSPLFALDPTDPQFKRSAAYMRQLRKKQKGGEEEATQVEEMQPPKEVKLLSANAPLKKHDSSQSEDTSFKNDKHELSSLIRRVKRKVESLQN